MASLTELQEVPPENVFLLVGSPGVGKSRFCQQAVLKNLAVDRPIIYVTTEYGPSRVEGALRERGLREVEPGLLNFVDAYNETVGVSVPDRPDTVYADCNDLSSIDIAISKLQDKIGKKGALLVFDSLTSPYLFSGPEILRFMRQTLSRFAARGNAVMACVDEGCGKPEDLVAMMSFSNGVVKMELKEGKRVLNVLKHPKVEPTRIEVPIEPERARIKKLFDYFDLSTFPKFIKLMRVCAWRREVGDFVNLFWPNLVHWSGMLWDPKGFPKMKYELNKEEMASMAEVTQLLPWHMKLFFKLFVPKSSSKVEDMKKMLKFYEKYGYPTFKQERSGIIEYLEDISKTDEHYFRVYESFDCWEFENVGAAMALYIPSSTAGMCEGVESLKGLEREWNAVETKCIGRGDAYCEFKLVPGEIDELRDSLEKESPVIERIHDRIMNRLMGFLLHGKPLVERPKLGSDIHVHAVGHTMGFPFAAGERYRMALRMGGAKAGKEVGEHLMEVGISGNEAVKRVLHLLEHCKVGKVDANETIRMKENCENYAPHGISLLKTKPKEPSCYFTTGFLNGFFWAVKNQHVKETKCIAMGDPYCEWEFR
jgi:predicted hydrocarbon binding protein/KaiC/GvpD/RAD55 family RecA-like ATPase